MTKKTNEGKEMNHTNLLSKYPDLIDKCRQWDCSYSEAIERIESQKQGKDRLIYYQE